MHKKGKGNTTHGLRNTKVYNVWDNMVRRCKNKAHPDYKNYGARGITVCIKWLSFAGFYEDMGGTYKEGLSLDRRENDKGYSKENCRWITQAEQMRNTRRNKKFNSETATDASVRLGGRPAMIFERLRDGWSIERAFTTKARKWK